MSVFGIAYNTYILPGEGGYVNDPVDRGGETYAGISRVNFPKWSGWSVIDAHKANAPIKRNTKFPELNSAVAEFYTALWNANNFGEIKNQNVANILFDWFINSGYLSVNTKNPETFGVDEILNRDFGFSLPSDSRFDMATINAINKVDNDTLYTTIKSERKRFYESIVKNNPTQEKFLKGWFNRLNQFPDIGTVGKISGVFIIFVIIILIATMNK